MKLSKLLNHLTLNQLNKYSIEKNSIIECNDGVFEEVIFEVKNEWNKTIGVFGQVVKAKRWKFSTAVWQRVRWNFLLRKEWLVLRT